MHPMHVANGAARPAPYVDDLGGMLDSIHCDVSDRNFTDGNYFR